MAGEGSWGSCPLPATGCSAEALEEAQRGPGSPHRHWQGAHVAGIRDPEQVGLFTATRAKTSPLRQ